MNQPLGNFIRTFGALIFLWIGFGVLPAVAAQENTAAPEEGVEVLTYGPIHEAFAETIQFDPEPGIIVPKAPPDDIQEIPPEQKPEGDVDWIPGYWAWDDDRADFIWLSGVWRAVPPDRQWVPGYWFKSGREFQWVSGYWALDKESDTEYLPEPPESVEVGPNIGAPSPNHGWIPGSWVWFQGRYAWRPGYWAVMQPDWIWVPAHYVWTPRGYIFVGGYWDFSIGHRGGLFAPVSFSFGVSVMPGFYFTPSFIINLGVFSDLIFLRPRYNHYYFGDYYAPSYYRKGIYPWFSPHVKRHGYDPIYAHQRWEHRNDRNWENRLQATYQERRNHVETRPSRQLYDVRKPGANVALPKTGVGKIVAPFPTVKRNGKSPTGYQPVSQKERTQIDRQGKEVRNYIDKRQKIETQKVLQPTAGSSERTVPNKVRLPKSPIAAKPVDRVDIKKAPPNHYKTPKPNPSVEPVQRRSTDYRVDTNVERPVPVDRGQSKTLNSNQPDSRGQSKTLNSNQPDSRGQSPHER